MEQKIEKMFFVLQVIAFQLGVPNSRNIEQVTCNQQPVG